MKPTTKISTLRSNSISIVNCSGFICRIAAYEPFKYGDRVVNQKASQGDYRIEIRGHYKINLPKPISFRIEAED